MSKREKTIGIILGIVVLIGGKNFLSRGTHNAPIAPAVQNSLPQRVEKTANPKEATFALEDALARLEIKKNEQAEATSVDPFQKVNPLKKSKNRVLEFSDLNLSGIMWENGEPAALINDEILKTGDLLAGFKVEAINENEVEISRGMEKHILTLSVPPKEKK